jgi:stage IV sporulation protein FB
MIFKFKLFGSDVIINRSAIWNFFYLFLFIKDLNMVTALFIFLTLMILVHEFGHVYFVRKFKYKVLGVSICFNGGECIHEPCKREIEEILIAWGGVIAQFILLIATIIIQALGNYIYPDLNTVFMTQFYEYAKLYNIIGIIYNLFPRDNLDGVKAWKILKFIKKQNGGKENE